MCVIWKPVIRNNRVLKISSCLGSSFCTPKCRKPAQPGGAWTEEDRQTWQLEDSEELKRAMKKRLDMLKMETCALVTILLEKSKGIHHGSAMYMLMVRKKTGGTMFPETVKIEVRKHFAGVVVSVLRWAETEKAMQL